MGQAKNRGSQSERIAAAKRKLDELRPAFIKCNDCGHEIQDVMDLKAPAATGIDAVFAGLCPECKATTYALKGSPDAIEKFMDAMSAGTGSLPSVGIQ